MSTSASRFTVCRLKPLSHFPVSSVLQYVLTNYVPWYTLGDTFILHLYAFELHGCVGFVSWFGCLVFKEPSDLQ